jgi:rsbT co-antagonist protein RsbR
MQPPTDGGRPWRGGFVSAGSWTDVLGKHRDEIFDRWSARAAATLGAVSTPAEVQRELSELRTVIGSVVDRPEGGASDDLGADEYGELRALLAELSRVRAAQGFSPSETAGTVFALKDATLDVIESHGDPDSYRQFAALARFVDLMGLFTFETFSRARESVIVEQSTQLMELATPVVKLWEGIIAVPLVGTLDSARTQVVMEKLLQALVDTGSEHAILDITGVPAVDTQVAQHLLKTVMAARLMGAECIISGIRPQIAQTIVALGIEFGEIMTKASMADALRAALRKTGVDVVGRPLRRD